MSFCRAPPLAQFRIRVEGGKRDEKVCAFLIIASLKRQPVPHARSELTRSRMKTALLYLGNSKVPLDLEQAAAASGGILP
jgi:hypothetical protein